MISWLLIYGLSLCGIFLIGCSIDAIITMRERSNKRLRSLQLKNIALRAEVKELQDDIGYMRQRGVL